MWTRPLPAKAICTESDTAERAGHHDGHGVEVEPIREPEVRGSSTHEPWVSRDGGRLPDYAGMLWRTAQDALSGTKQLEPGGPDMGPMYWHYK